MTTGDTDVGVLLFTGNTNTIRVCFSSREY